MLAFNHQLSPSKYFLLSICIYFDDVKSWVLVLLNTTFIRSTVCEREKNSARSAIPLKIQFYSLGCISVFITSGELIGTRWMQKIIYVANIEFLG